MTEPASVGAEPTAMTSLAWHAGERVDVSDREWSATVASFLGSGYRVRFPRLAHGVPLQHARLQADRVAGLLGTQVDPEPWLWAARRPANGAGVEVVGGWPYGLDRRFGAPWTRVTVLGPARPEARRTRGLTLPWAYASDSPTAGLPMISSLEAGIAERVVAERGAGVGLWWNHRDELCATTAGAPLVCDAHGTWLFPAPSSGLVTSWAATALAQPLGATPAVVTRDTLLGSRAVGAVGDLGSLTLVERIDGAAATAEPEAVSILVAARDAVVG